MYIFSANFILSGTAEQCNLVRKKCITGKKRFHEKYKQQSNFVKIKIKTESNKTNPQQDLMSKRFYH